MDMKLHDILPPQQLDEITLKQAIAAGLIGASALSPRVGLAADKAPRPAVTQPANVVELKGIVKAVSDRFGVDPKMANMIVRIAHKHEHPDFPTAEDILAVIGVESKFKPKATSQLKQDPALGLMQIRPGVWKIPPKELFNIESNIKHGARILRDYYKKLDGNEDAALQAYNIGITAFKKGKTNPHYLRKVKTELAHYEYPDEL